MMMCLLDAGANKLDGGAGNDFLKGGEGADYIDGGSGNDTVSYTGSGSGVNIDGSADTASGGDATGDVVDSMKIISALLIMISLSETDISIYWMAVTGMMC